LNLTNLSVSVAESPAVSQDGAQVVFTTGPQSGSGAAVYRTSTNTTSDRRAFQPVYVPRFLNVNGVNSVSGNGSPSPGSIISAYGVNLVPDELVQATTLPLPTTLDGITLLVNGQPAPLFAVTPWQINAQLPQNMAIGNTTFQARYSDTSTLPAIAVPVKS